MYTISKFICLFVCIVGVSCTPTHSETCSYWENIAKGYSRYADDSGTRSVTCQAHQNSCNGFNCSGMHTVVVPIIQNLNLSFCFGLTINHCDNPPSVDYYLQLASPRVEETYERVKVNESKPIGNLSFGSAIIHIRPYLFFMYTKESNSRILFEVKIKCKVTTYGIEEWPEPFQLTVFPRREIPYTPCSGTETVPPIQKPPKCTPYMPSGLPTAKPHTGKPHPTKYPPHIKPTNAPVAPTKSTQVAPTENTMATKEKHTTNVPTTVTMATPQTVKPRPSKYPLTKPTKHPIAPIKSKTLGKPCTLGAMQGATCGVNETCVGNGDKGYCDCQFNFKKEDGACKKINDQGPILPTWNPSVKKTTQTTATTPKNIQVSTSRVISQQASGTKINMTALIVGSVLGGLIVIVLIATIVVFVIRKRRMYYRGHQLLLTEEDTDVVI